MRRFVDLHTHSTASDGGMGPRELVRLAEAKRLAALALTDHDTTAGLAEAAEEAARFPALRFVPGIEVSAEFAGGTMHILGLGIDPAAPALCGLVAQLRAARDERNPRIVERLQALGLPISMDDVLAAAADRGMGDPPIRIVGPVAGILPARAAGVSAASVTGAASAEPQRNTPGSRGQDAPATQRRDGAPKRDSPRWGTPALATRTIGRLHIAEALRRKGCVRSLDEAFERWIGYGCPAYVDKERLAPADVVRAIAGSGGAAVLAHPPQLHCENRAQLERIVRNLRSAGLAALEAYHTDHTPQQTRQYMDLARRLGLAVTGGSDFHGAPKPDARLGRPPVPLAAIEGPLREILTGGR